MSQRSKLAKEILNIQLAYTVYVVAAGICAVVNHLAVFVAACTLT